MAKSTYSLTAALNVFLRNTAYTAPVTVYLALMNSTTEAVGGSYARQAITFAIPSAGAVASSNAQTFTSMPAMTVNTVAIYDAATVGNQLYTLAVTTAKTTNAGDTVSVAAGAIIVSEA